MTAAIDRNTETWLTELAKELDWPIEDCERIADSADGNDDSIPAVRATLLAACGLPEDA